MTNSISEFGVLGPPSMSAVQQPLSEASRLIDYDALLTNARLLQQKAHPAKMVAVVKADAYGHGAVHVCQRLAEIGIDWFAVARMNEAEQLRSAAISGRILVLENIPAQAAPRLSALQATPVLSSLQQLQEWAGVTSALTRPTAVHLKINTGLNRLGIEPSDFPQAVDVLRRAPGLWLEGIATHFSQSEDLDDHTTAEQEAKFAAVLADVPANERPSIMVHAANSCAVRHWPGSHFDAVRCGGGLYGLDLAAVDGAGESPKGQPLAPVMSVVAPVVQTRTLQPGQRVGYGGIWQAGSETTLAVVPVGYADGYPSHIQSPSFKRESRLGRSAGDSAHVLIRGHRCPLVGRISMDRITVDASGIAAELRAGDESVLLGRQGELRITAGQLARWGRSSLYEVTTRFSLRLPVVAS